MKYENSKHKIITIYNNEVINDDKIAKVEKDLHITKVKLNNLNLVGNIKRNIYDIYSSDWEDMEIFSVEGGDGNIYGTYKEWRIELPNIPIKYFPFINVKILYEFNPTDNFDMREDIKQAYFFQIDDIDAGVVKKPVLIAGINFLNESSAVFSQFKVKLLVTISNPETYL